MTLTEKLSDTKPREFWLNTVTGKYYDNANRPNSIVHVVEFSALTQANEEIEKYKHAILHEQKFNEEKIDELQAVIDRLTKENEHIQKLFNEWENLLGEMPGVKIHEILKERDQLRAELEKLRGHLHIETSLCNASTNSWQLAHDERDRYLQICESLAELLRQYRIAEASDLDADELLAEYAELKSRGE